MAKVKGKNPQKKKILVNVAGKKIEKPPAEKIVSNVNADPAALSSNYRPNNQDVNADPAALSSNHRPIDQTINVEPSAISSNHMPIDQNINVEPSAISSDHRPIDQNINVEPSAISSDHRPIYQNVNVDPVSLSINNRAVDPNANGDSAALPSNQRLSEQGKESENSNGKQFSGFIFMCNERTKPECYRYRVFGLPLGKLAVVQKINLGAKLFLFDTESKLLYGVYEATSNGESNLELAAFGGRYPAQVKFKILKDCLPLHEHSFRNAIQENYEGRRFKSELNNEQVNKLLSLFRPVGSESVMPLPHAPPSMGSHYVQPSGLLCPNGPSSFSGVRRARVPENLPPNTGDPCFRYRAIPGRATVPQLGYMNVHQSHQITHSIPHATIAPPYPLPPSHALTSSYVSLPSRPPNHVYANSAPQYHPASPYTQVPPYLLPPPPPPPPYAQVPPNLLPPPPPPPYTQVPPNLLPPPPPPPYTQVPPNLRPPPPPPPASSNQLYANSLQRPTSGKSQLPGSKMPVSSLYSFNGAVPAYQ